MKSAAVFGFIVTSTQALASPLALYPVQTGAEAARYNLGVPVLSVVTETGGLQIQPLPIEHGHLAFGVSVYNASGIPQNFGAENIQASVEGQEISLLSLDQLEHQARRRAAWSKFGTAMLAGLAAGVASNAHTTDTAYTSVYTPHGAYGIRTTYRDYSVGAQAAGNIIDAGTHTISNIQDRLDVALNTLSGSLIRTTTLDPSASYSGIIVLDTISSASLPQDIHLNIVWAGSVHPFVFRLTRQGQNVPNAYTPVQAAAPAVRTIAQPALFTPPPAQPTMSPAQPVSQQPQPSRQAILSLVSAPQPSIDLDAVSPPPAQIPQAAPISEPESLPLNEDAREQIAYQQGAALARAQLQASEIETEAKIRAWQKRQQQQP